MSVSKFALKKFFTTADISPLARGRRAVTSAVSMIEPLEGRRLMTATIALVNPVNLPASNRLIFNYVQNPDTTTPNVVHDTQQLLIKNTGDTALVISSIVISGPWAFVNPVAGGYTNISVAAGDTLPITLQFTQRTLPAHTYNQTNFTSSPDGGASITGTVTINSNDTTAPSKVVQLAGYWQNVSNNNNEPNLQTIVNLLAGYRTNINPTPTPTLNQSTGKTLYGTEVVADSWEAAVPTQAVSLQQLGAFRTEGNNATVYWYTSSGQQSHKLFTDAANQGQSLLPTLSNGTNAQASFTPTGAFGIRVDNEYSTDSINNNAGNTGGGGHHFRFYPLVDNTGNTVANTFIVAMDYGTLQSENFDFQDNVFVVGNIRPATTPGTPTGLTATAGSSPVLNWTAVSYIPVSYNVSSSPTIGGTYTLLTPTPLTSPTFTDTSNTGTPVYYHVTAVDSTQSPPAESFPATTSSNTGPIAVNDTYNVYVGGSVTFNALVNDTDATGTINPASVTITAPNHGGTAVVDHTNGNITYTSNGVFTGNENFTYTVTDSNNQTSAPATITINVSPPIITAPVANNEVTTTLQNTPLSIPVLTVDNAVTTFNPASVTITTQPSSGNVTVDTATGNVLYTPSTNFVGGDKFLYTVNDNNGQTSNTATVDINVGVEISSARGAAKTLVYTDQNGTPVTITLNKGIADVFFDGIGTVVSTVKGKTTVAGSNLRARQITLSGTTVASTLKITAAKNGQMNLGGITDGSPIGSILAPGANLRAVGTSTLLGLGTQVRTFVAAEAAIATPINSAGTINLAGVKNLSLRSTTSAKLILGSTGVTGTTLSVAGKLTDTGLIATDAVTIKAKSWVKSATDIQAVNVASLKAMTISGEFDPDLTVNGGLGTVKVGGPVSIGSWSVTGNAKSIAVGSASTTWGGLQVSGNLATFTVASGNLTADVSAASINTMKVAGAISTTVSTTGNLLTLQAGQLVNALIQVGSSATNITNATLANLGGATLKTLKVTSKAANSFNDSSVIAFNIGSVTTGPVNAASGSVPEGIAAHTIKSATVTVDGGVLHLAAKDLVSDAALATYLSTKGATFGMFAIKIL